MKKVLALGALIVLTAAGCSKSQPSTDRSNPTPTTVAQNPYPTDTSGWATYTDASLGIQFQYPADWDVSPATPDQAKLGTIASFQSPYGLQRSALGDSYSNDLVVSHWSSVNANVSSQGQTKYKNLAEMMADKNSPFTKEISEFTVGGKPGYKVSTGGFGENEGLMVENNGVYQLSFETVDNGHTADGAVTNIVDLVGSTFKFTK